MKYKTLRIKDIVIDPKLYPREQVNQSVVKSYAKAMNEGDKFPEIFVASYEKKYLLVDGRHRLEAYEENGEQYVRCEIMSNFPNYEDIYLAAVKANLTHGTRLSDSDKLGVANRMKDMEFDLNDIAKLLHIPVKSMGKLKVHKIKRVVFGKKIKDGPLKAVITDKVEQKEELPLVDKLTEQVETLENFYAFLQQDDLILTDKDVVRRIRKIRKRSDTILSKL